MSREFLSGRVLVTSGDITEIAIDAIVNAANSTLLGGGGVDGAIHDAGGPEVLKACRELRRRRYPDGLPTGEAVITTGGKLPARFVIHTVGPIWGRDSNAEELLAACYRNCVGIAEAEGLAELAFPAISTGAYGYPKAQAARVASLAIASALAGTRSVRRVQLVFFSPADAQMFVRHQEF